MSKEKSIVSKENIIDFLDNLYEKSLDGIPYVSPSIQDLAEDYLSKHETKEKACKEMHKNQVIKCSTSGAVAGLGGLITMPVAIPANIGNVLYVQMRMIACTAYMAGYDLKSDQTQTLVYACLAGVGVNQFFKKAGVTLGQKVTTAMINKIPGKALIEINKKVGTRLFTKFGSKGIVNLGKLVPGVGAAIGGGLDFIETKAIANRAYKWFFESDFEDKTKKKEEFVETEYEYVDVNDEDIKVENSEE